MPNRPGSSVPKLERAPLTNANGKPVWHKITPNRFVTDLPSVSKGPIRARAFRDALDPLHQGVADGTGTPQLPERRAQPRS